MRTCLSDNLTYMGSICRSRSARRNRTGCWNCKNQKRRCSEEHPSCSRCVRQGLACSYGLRLQWEDEMRCAGIASGRAAQHNRTPETTYYLLPVPRGRLRWLHTTADEVRRYSYEDASRTPDEPADGPLAALKLSLPAPLSSLPSLEHNDGTLLQYYKPWNIGTNPD
ncbi:uncharacterized protein BKA55DRAFT_586782 [Fusarium redolens]|uniref:Zn(2)-C6 fungal-type domain-containing protein n=1 Tax=Fusarium redolens TaxID=48865 RepID=A0A9P9JSU0_FUSRE|nr:uncharacterized protein BKA55DRAFT_586782 [Fusarium redolens]KAH7205430.1 hypothetical protein BKA55DRAFT_586782 [Fusarium redolens]